eukprot:jgi/Botrbrau1/20103/Bobra.0173s0007.1
MKPFLACSASNLKAACLLPVRLPAIQLRRSRQMQSCSPTIGDFTGSAPGFVPPKAAETSEASVPLVPPKPERLKSNFCKQCGGSIALAIPEGEKEWRHVCDKCGFVDYMNPKMVVGCIVEHEGQVLLCRRAIEPCRGKWTVPAGYMELNESSMEGACRETWEEAQAHVEVLAPYAHFDIPLIGQSYILFRARLLPPFTFGSGPESLETVLMKPEDIPFDQIAFSSVSIALRYYLDDMASGRFHVHHGVIEKQPGSLPNDPSTFKLRNHFAIRTDARPSQ